MKFDRSNKFDLCYYGQVNSLRLKSTVASNRQVNAFGGTIFFAGHDTTSCILNKNRLRWQSCKNKCSCKKKKNVKKNEEKPLLSFVDLKFGQKKMLQSSVINKAIKTFKDL